MRTVEYDEFKSELGNVAVSHEHVEREHRKSEKWEKIRENFREGELLEKVYYRDIEDVEFEAGEMFPNIKVELEDGLKRLFFMGEDDARECFKLLEYRVQAYRQNHR